MKKKDDLIDLYENEIYENENLEDDESEIQNIDECFLPKDENIEEKKAILEEELIIEEKYENEKNKNRYLIIILIISSLIIIILLIYLFFIKDKVKKPSNTNETTTPLIQRPSKNNSYVVLKDNAVKIICRKSKNGDKIVKLTKGLVVACELSFESNNKISDIYFDLNTSSNIKYINNKNETDYKLINEDNTYLLSTSKPKNSENSFLFYFEIINNSDSEFVEINNIILKDENDNYYKVLNDMSVFPPEYEDKIYIYRSTYDEDESEEIYYYALKSKINDTTDILFDTYKCNNETCEVKTIASNYLLIYDEKFILYDVVKKTTQTIKTNEDLSDYSYEIMIGEKSPYGVAFKKEYVSNDDCDTIKDYCIVNGLNGNPIGYYSFNEGMFTIDKDLGIIGQSVYLGYDKALMLSKDGEVGIYSFEDDKMILNFTSKYLSIEFDYLSESIKLERYDKTNDIYYFEYYNPTKESYTVNVNNINKFDNNIYYITTMTRNNKEITLLFNSKGEAIKNLPYVLTDNLISVTDKIVVKNSNKYDVYNTTGTKIYTTLYVNDVISNTSSYLIIRLNNKLELHDLKGNKILDIIELVDGMEFISAKEENQTLTIIIKDTAIAEENKNAYKYTIKNNQIIEVETILVD